MRVGDAWPGSRCGHGAKRKVPKTSAPSRQIAPRAGCAFRSSETTPKSPFDPLSVPPPVVDTGAHRQASRRCPFLPPPPNQAKSAHPSHNTTHRRNRSMHSLRTSAPLATRTGLPNMLDGTAAFFRAPFYSALRRLGPKFVSKVRRRDHSHRASPSKHPVTTRDASLIVQS